VQNIYGSKKQTNMSRMMQSRHELGPRTVSFKDALWQHRQHRVQWRVPGLQQGSMSDCCCVQARHMLQAYSKASRALVAVFRQGTYMLQVCSMVAQVLMCPKTHAPILLHGVVQMLMCPEARALGLRHGVVQVQMALVRAYKTSACLHPCTQGRCCATLLWHKAPVIARFACGEPSWRPDLLHATL